MSRPTTIIALPLFIASLVVACVQGPASARAQPKPVDNCSYGSGGHTVCTVSILALISNPEEYYGKELHVVGFLAIDVGALKVWTGKDSFLHDIDANSILIDIPYEKAVVLAKGKNRSYCAIVGVFQKASDKKLGLHSTNSVLTDVARIFSAGERIDSELDWQILMEADHRSDGNEQTD